jgi:AcrR family transcriptional regulator
VRTASGERRQQILDASATLFAEHGFHNVSLAEIGRAVGISGPALYRHFESKDAILGTTLVVISEQLLADAKDISEKSTDPRAQLQALVDAHVDFAVTRPELIILQWREFAHLRGEDRRTVRRLQRNYVDLWAALLIRLHPELSIPEAGGTAIAAFGLMNSTPFSGSRLSPEEARPLLRRLTRQMLEI